MVGASSIPESLREALKQKKVLPFIGAGVSMAVTDTNGNRVFPSWKELLLKAAERLDSENKQPIANLIRALLNIDPPDYYQAAERARDGLPKQIWMDLLKSSLTPEKSKIEDSTLELARSVWKLRSNLIITLNYDKVLNWACPNFYDLQTWNVDTPHGQDEIVRDNVNKPTIWHLHGHIDAMNDIILTPDGYKELYSDSSGLEAKYQGALETLRHVFRAKTILFIGLSLSDPNLIKQIEWVNRTFKGLGGPHYILVRSSEVIQIKEKLSELEITPITFADFGEPLIQLLDEMISICSNPL